MFFFVAPRNIALQFAIIKLKLNAYVDKCNALIV